MTVCGGEFSTSTRTSCLNLIQGTWRTAATLLKERYHHSSWASPSGVRILGGHGGPWTSERIQEDGTSVGGFTLEFPLYGACTINMGSSALLTGGLYSANEVSEYNQNGYQRKLPQLLPGRFYHGCSYFDNEDGTKTFLVTGGYNGDYISSTELLLETSSNWIYSGELPTPRGGLRGANIDRRVIMTGGYDGGYLNEILEYEPNNGKWSLVGQMS